MKLIILMKSVNNLLKAYFCGSSQLQSFEFERNNFGFGSGGGFIFSKQKYNKS